MLAMKCFLEADSAALACHPSQNNAVATYKGIKGRRSKHYIPWTLLEQQWRACELRDHSCGAISAQSYGLFNKGKSRSQEEKYRVIQDDSEFECCEQSLALGYGMLMPSATKKKSWNRLGEKKHHLSTILAMRQLHRFHESDL
jgi:hypothetical protein